MLLARLSAFSHFCHYPQANWAILVLTPMWVVLCTFQDPVGLSNELFCEAEHFSHCLNCHRFFQSEVLRLYFPMLDPWVIQSVSLPSCSSWFICKQIWDHLLCQLPPCLESSPPPLSVSTSPTSLGECFFFNSLVVGCPYSSIFCQFWLFLFLNFLLSFFLVV